MNFEESLEILKNEYYFINYENIDILEILENHWNSNDNDIIKSRINKFYITLFKYKNSNNVNFWLERGFSIDYANNEINKINNKRSLKLKEIKKENRQFFLSYDECKKFVILNNIKTKFDYFNFKKPKNVPSDPYKFYKGEWENWTKFLTDKNSRKSINYYSYFECKEQIKKYNITSKNIWFKIIKVIISEDEKIPYNPYKVYKNFNWSDFLGTNRIQDNKKEYLNYNQTKIFVKKLNLKSSKEWKLYCKSGNKPENITSKPYKKFKEFKSFSDFLGYEPFISLGEKRIEEFLLKNKIFFIKQKRFKECKNIRTLPFDFYLPKNDICIEFDGPQHDILSNYFNMTEQDFYRLRENDLIKSNFCLQNNINLIRIKYKEINNINNILNIKLMNKKFTKTYEISDYEILTDNGFTDIDKLHETIEYDVWKLKTISGKELKCADNHIVFMPLKGIQPVTKDFKDIFIEIFVKDLKIGDKIIIDSETEDYVESVENLGYKEKMFDFELTDNSNRRYFTNDILSHNTETAKVIAEEIFGPNSLIRIDMSEYSEKISSSRLTGAAPGYVGYEEGGQLTESVRRKPFSVVLFDEIEKAHPDIFNVLLQILDEGRLTDNTGRVVSFKNTIIIMTSNIGVKKAQQMGKGVGFNTSTSIKDDEAMKNNIMKSLKDKFPPEFLNRINELVTFNQLDENNIKDIVKIQLNKLKKRIDDIGYNLSWTTEVIDFISKETFEPLYGARPVERGIQKLIEDLISEEILRHEPEIGKMIKIDYNKDNNLSCVFE